MLAAARRHAKYLRTVSPRDYDMRIFEDGSVSFATPPWIGSGAACRLPTCRPGRAIFGCIPIGSFGSTFSTFGRDMIASPFAQTAPGLIQSGYSPLPLMPGEKKPGTYDSRDGWHLMKNWQKYCGYVPFPNVVAMWATWPNAGVGVALGRGLICIDIDQENLIDPLLAILPPCFVQKKGRKGISLFYRGNTEVIRSKNYRTPEKVGLVDLLAEGKQTVLPPSIHPDTGEPYYWWSDLALQDVVARRTGRASERHRRAHRRSTRRASAMILTGIA